ncbi:hypothetical protein [Ralstonia sp. UBA689]|uniref:hypothetical protein n=1 Tax=Ralstonia sp. UBA689 TaxID=1947373 RepID=UPI0025DD4DE3|nr:hypothetical protein [Ralstonia sp. UBA689]
MRALDGAPAQGVVLVVDFESGVDVFDQPVKDIPMEVFVLAVDDALGEVAPGVPLVVGPGVLLEQVVDQGVSAVQAAAELGPGCAPSSTKFGKRQTIKRFGLDFVLPQRVLINIVFSLGIGGLAVQGQHPCVTPWAIGTKLLGSYR